MKNQPHNTKMFITELVKKNSKNGIKKFGSKKKPQMKHQLKKPQMKHQLKNPQANQQLKNPQQLKNKTMNNLLKSQANPMNHKLNLQKKLQLKKLAMKQNQALKNQDQKNQVQKSQVQKSQVQKSQALKKQVQKNLVQKKLDQRNQVKRKTFSSWNEKLLLNTNIISLISMQVIYYIRSTYF